MGERLFYLRCLVPVSYYRAIQSGHPERIRAAKSRQAAREFLESLPPAYELEIEGPEVRGYSCVTNSEARCYRLTVWELVQ